MSTQITIDGISEEVLARLEARAASRSQPLQEFLRRELNRIALMPSSDGSKLPVDQWLRRVRAHKRTTKNSVTTDAILAARDVDRK